VVTLFFTPKKYQTLRNYFFHLISQVWLGIRTKIIGLMFFKTFDVCLKCTVKICW